MPNSKLENKYYECPDKIIKVLKERMASYNGDKDDEGYKRAKGIINNPRIKQSHMERIADWFVNNTGGDAYELNGGDMMRFWVENELKNKRASVKQSSAKDTVTTKNNHQNVNKIEGERDNNKNATIPVSTTYKEEVESIKYLIEYMDNNKKRI